MSFGLSIYRTLAPFIAFAALQCNATIACADTSEEKTEATGAGSPPALVLDIARRSLKNFLTDESALTPYRLPNGRFLDLEDAFTIGSASSRFALIWDPLTCRMVGVLDITAPPPVKPALPSSSGETEFVEGIQNPSPAPLVPYVLMASGFSPFTGSLGTSGNPEFFGFRMVDGIPEFLYTHGSLVIEERLWLEEGGEVLKQRFSIRDAQNEVLLTLPQSWRDRLDVNVGSWRNQTLYIPADRAKSILLSFRLGASEQTEEGAP